MLHTLSTRAILLALILGPETNYEGAHNSNTLRRFKICIDRCFVFNMDCNSGIKSLWNNYSNKRVLTKRHLKKCCLESENLENGGPSNSFVTCARTQCGAMLWG